MSSLRDVLDYEELPEEVRKIADKYVAAKVEEDLEELKGKVEELEQKIEDLEMEKEQEYERGYDMGYDDGLEANE